MKGVILSLLLVVVVLILFVNYYSGTGFFGIESRSEDGQEIETRENNEAIEFDYSVKSKGVSSGGNEGYESSDNEEVHVGEAYTESQQLPPPQQQAIDTPAPVITEVELNPLGSDSGNEWVEMFYHEDIDFIGDYYLENSDGDRLNLTGSYTGFFVINLPGQWLDNTNEKVYLKYQDGDLLAETPLMNDSLNNDKTWNRCLSKWVMNYATPVYWNNCTLTCLGDLDYNNNIDGADLGTLLGAWGWLENGYSDLTGDGRINETDTDYLLSKWGVCS